MWRRICVGGSLLLLSMVAGIVAKGQDTRVEKKFFYPGKNLPGYFTGFFFSEKAEYNFSVTGFSYINWSHDMNMNNIIFMQNFKYYWQSVSPGKVRFSNQVVHSIGLQIFPDSITRFHVDENTITTRLEIPLVKKLNLSFSSIISTRIFNGYDYFTNDSGKLARKLNSCFLTPLVWNICGGISIDPAASGILTVGVSGFKVTWLMAKDIFEEQETENYYGVEKKNGYLLEYGLSLQFTADRDLSKWMHWNCDFLFFKKQNTPWDLNLKNQFSFKITGHLRLNLQSRLFYEEQLSKKVQFESLVSLGFALMK